MEYGYDFDYGEAIGRVVGSAIGLSLVLTLILTLAMILTLTPAFSRWHLEDQESMRIAQSTARHGHITHTQMRRVCITWHIK